MSYILDALRRAEAERGRGGVPGLHTQTVPVHGAAPAATRPLTAHPALLLTGALTLVAVAAGGTWWVMQREHGVPAVVPVAAPPAASGPNLPPVAAAPPAPVPQTATASVPSVVDLPSPAAIAASPVPPAPAAALPERRVAEKRVAEKPRERPATEPAVQRPAPVAEPSRQRLPAGAPPAVAAAAAPGPSTPAPGQNPAAAPPPAAPVFAQADLPEAIRSQLPVLKISGATYSNNPAHRMAIVNGQVLVEGDQAGPGLVLERVEPSRTVWSFRGYRYAVGSQ